MVTQLLNKIFSQDRAIPRITAGGCAFLGPGQCKRPDIVQASITTEAPVPTARHSLYDHYVRSDKPNLSSKGFARSVIHHTASTSIPIVPSTNNHVLPNQCAIAEGTLIPTKSAKAPHAAVPFTKHTEEDLAATDEPTRQIKPSLRDSHRIITVGGQVEAWRNGVKVDYDPFLEPEWVREEPTKKSKAKRAGQSSRPAVEDMETVMNRVIELENKKKTKHVRGDASNPFDFAYATHYSRVTGFSAPPIPHRSEVSRSGSNESAAVNVKVATTGIDGTHGPTKGTTIRASALLTPAFKTSSVVFVDPTTKSEADRALSREAILPGSDEWRLIYGDMTPSETELFDRHSTLQDSTAALTSSELAPVLPTRPSMAERLASYPSLYAAGHESTKTCPSDFKRSRDLKERTKSSRSSSSDSSARTGDTADDTLLVTPPTSLIWAQSQGVEMTEEQAVALATQLSLTDDGGKGKSESEETALTEAEKMIRTKQMGVRKEHAVI